MAKTQQREGTEYVALPKGSIETLNDGEPVTDEEAAFDEFIAGMSAERMGELRVGKLKLGKDGTPTVNTKGQHCFACPIDQFTYSGLLEHIRNRFGGGLYRVVGIEQGKRGLQFNRLIEIAEELPSQKPGESSHLQNPSNVFESVGRLMAESAARTEALIGRLTETRPAAVDPMDGLQKMATVFATMMGVVQKPAGNTGAELLVQLETFDKIKSLFGGGEGKGDGGGGENGAEFMDVIKAGIQSFGPALGALASQRMQQPSQPAAALPPPQPYPAFVPPHVPQPQPQPAAAPAGNDPMQAQLKSQVDILVSNAKNGADPAQLADLILRMTPDDKIDDLGNMLDAPDMVDKMAALNPEVQNYRDFFEKLRAALLALLEPADATTLPPNGAPPAGGSSAPTS